MELGDIVSDDTESVSAGLGPWLTSFISWAANVRPLDVTELDCDERDVVESAGFDDAEVSPWSTALIS